LRGPGVGDEPQQTARERGGWLLALAILVPVAALQAWWTRLDLGLLLDHLTNDDTFLYLQVVRNLAESGKCTFDGIHVTTGIQPLWTAILVPLARAVPDKIEFLRYVLLVSVVLNLFAGLLLARAAVALSGRRVAAFLTAALWAGYMLRMRPAMIGMESGLIACSFSALVAFLACHPPIAAPRWRWRLGLAILAALTFLSRTDSVILLVGIGVLILVLLRRASGAWGPTVRVGSILAGLSLLFVAPYLVYNWTESGRLLPVSGAVKMWYATQDLPEAGRFAYEALRECGARVIVVVDQAIPLVLPIGDLLDLDVNRFGLVTGAVLLLAATLALRGLARAVLLTLLLACTLHVLAFTSLLGRFGASTWYFVPEYACAIGFLGVMLAKAAAGRPRAGCYLGISLVLLLAPQAFMAQRKIMATNEDGLFRTRYELTEKIRETLPDDAIIGSWNAGQLGYFSERTVVNLDGLVNDTAYYEFLRERGDVREYLMREGIRYIADYNRRDASMSRSKKWDTSKTFRDIWPLEDLKILLRHGRFMVFEVPGSPAR
jgi:hypothetical protein